MRLYLMQGLAAILVASLLAGCGGPATTTPATATPATATPAAATSPTRVANGATATPRTPGSTQTPAKAGSPRAGGTPVTNPAVQAAIQEAAQQRNVAPSTIQVVSVEAVEWPDTALGCPEPGRAYAQVITPGYRVTLEVSGQRVVYHTTRTGDRVVTC